MIIERAIEIHTYIQCVSQCSGKAKQLKYIAVQLELLNYFFGLVEYTWSMARTFFRSDQKMQDLNTHELSH